jgi:hypothetical protein
MLCHVNSSIFLLISSALVFSLKEDAPAHPFKDLLHGLHSNSVSRIYSTSALVHGNVLWIDKARIGLQKSQRNNLAFVWYHQFLRTQSVVPTVVAKIEVTSNTTKTSSMVTCIWKREWNGCGIILGHF